MSDFWGGLSTILNPISTITNMIHGFTDRADNRAEAQRNQANTKWQQDFSSKQFDYMMQQNDIMREREDNAMQRRVEDLKKAGLNPLTALGAGQSMAQLGSSAAVPPGSGSPVRQNLSNTVADIELARLRNETKVADAQAQNYRDTGQAALEQAGVASDRLDHDKIVHTDLVAQWAKENKINTDDVAVRQTIARTQKMIEYHTERMQRDNLLHQYDMLQEQKTQTNIKQWEMRVKEESARLTNLLTTAEIAKLDRDLGLRTQAEIREWFKIALMAYITARAASH